ncbi:NADH dehydrogenase [ubiquinone] 1 alpha subcomplex subunit 7-like [Lineus longissimus]|uniref:NADH dehydrogenase [ubiquinone] 1 alpha subcomplex subunit 7-like n=1 Tax=Lineus longissimus TaxID=88925 RepID=UPI002B4F8EC3
MSAPRIRSVTPIIAWIRDFCLQRKFNMSQRFVGVNTSPRDQPDPTIPGGVAHELSANYYYSRDGRRSHKPPTIPYDAGQKRIASGEGAEAIESSPKLPGFGYDGGQFYK